MVRTLDAGKHGEATVGATKGSAATVGAAHAQHKWRD